MKANNFLYISISKWREIWVKVKAEKLFHCVHLYSDRRQHIKVSLKTHRRKHKCKLKSGYNMINDWPSTFFSSKFSLPKVSVHQWLINQKQHILKILCDMSFQRSTRIKIHENNNSYANSNVENTLPSSTVSANHYRNSLNSTSRNVFRHFLLVCMIWSSIRSILLKIFFKICHKQLMSELKSYFKIFYFWNSSKKFLISQFWNVVIFRK